VIWIVRRREMSDARKTYCDYKDLVVAAAGELFQRIRELWISRGDKGIPWRRALRKCDLAIVRFTEHKPTKNDLLRETVDNRRGKLVDGRSGKSIDEREPRRPGTFAYNSG
jgi:hypothetical protein